MWRRMQGEPNQQSDEISREEFLKQLEDQRQSEAKFNHELVDGVIADIRDGEPCYTLRDEEVYALLYAKYHQLDGNKTSLLKSRIAAKLSANRGER